ncbi:MAG: beta-lactamase family protein [Prolixibacteraceae bacterium]|nr:beta-lactamase family protein [Prolixibacteraceae bacterium]
MERKFFVRILLICCIIGCWGCTQKKESADTVYYDKKYVKVIKEARRNIYFYVSGGSVPGGAIAVSINGELVWSEGIGFASRDLGARANRETKFRVGYVSELMTALACRNMAHAHILDLNETVQRYYPEFPEKEYPVTLQNLLMHTSGIRQPNADFSNTYSQGLEQETEKIFADSLLFMPGMYQYHSISNTNLLGMVMQKAAGESFAKVMNKWLLDTLKMKNTVPDNPLVTIKGRSNFFDRDIIAQVINAPFRDFRDKLPAEGYLSTAEDLVKMGNALLFDSALPPKVRKEMLEIPVMNDYNMEIANGLFYETNLNNERFFMSRGNTTGGTAILYMHPENKVVVAWVANISDLSSSEMQIFQIISDFTDFVNGEFKTAEEKRKEKQS